MKQSIFCLGLHVNPWFPDKSPVQTQPPLEHEESSMIIDDYDESETQAYHFSPRNFQNRKI